MSTPSDATSAPGATGTTDATSAPGGTAAAGAEAPARLPGLVDLAEIGHGAFSVVYRATEVAFDRVVAVKVLRSPLVGDAVRRFQQECLALGRISGHPHVVAVHSTGVDALGRGYLVMDHMAGGSLADRLRRAGPLPLAEALVAGVQVASALAAAHDVGLLHRDVKPANVLVSAFGDHRLSDFGIASIGGAALDGWAGTPGYAPPGAPAGVEQAAAHDVYGVAATLVALAIGSRPDGGPDHVAGRLRSAGVPDVLVRCLAACLAADPEGRSPAPPGPLAVAEAIQEAQAQLGHQITAVPVAHRAGPVAPAGVLAVPPAATPRGNLPEPLADVVARERDGAEVLGLLAGNRLVTLCGAGGVGKTTLALYAARRVQPVPSDGVWFADLASVTTGAVSGTVARTLGAAGTGDALADHLRERDLLLVVDNCEHVVDEAAALVQDLLERCRGLRVLATSRQPLGISGERVTRVPSLGVPAADDPPDQIERCPSVELLALRWEAAGGPVPLDPATAARICRRLDGIPLAIELAAAQAPALSAREVADALDDRFGLLDVGRRGTSRHRTLSAAVRWSYDLLDADERRVLRACSAFSARFTLDGAAAVAALDRARAVEVVARLVASSLVGRTDEPAGYRLLESVKAFARGCVDDEGEGDELAGRHLRHVTAVARRADAAIATEDAGEELRRLDDLAEDSGAALRWSIERGDRTGVELGARLAAWWLVRDRAAEACEHLAAVLDGFDPETSEVWASLQRGYASALAARGEHHRAEGIFLDAIERSRAIDDRAGTGRALLGLGNTLLRLGRFDEAEAELTAGLALLDGDPRSAANAMRNLGELAWRRGQPAEATRWYEDSLALSRTHGDQRGAARALANLAAFARRAGDAALAWERYEESVALARAVGEVPVLLTACRVMTDLALDAGDLEVAAARLEVWREAVLDYAGSQALVPLLERDARLCAARGRLDVVAQIVGAVDAASPEAPAGLDALRDQARASLGPDQFGRHFERGASGSLRAVAQRSH